MSSATPRRALITGATGLLGREITSTFRDSGWYVKGTAYARADGIDLAKLDLQSEDTTKLETLLDEIRCVHCIIR